MVCRETASKQYNSVSKGFPSNYCYNLHTYIDYMTYYFQQCGSKTEYVETDLALVAVNSEKFKQWVHALLVMEELCRKVTVKELHAISNGL